MKSFAILSLAAAAAAQGVTDVIVPPGGGVAGCSSSRDGTFNLAVAKVAGMRKRQQAGILTLTLQDGILKDQAGRTAYIADNYQFQFDAPPQTGALSTAGYAVCGNNSLALGPSTVFYQCLSGDFYNLYDRNWAPQCEPIHLQAIAQGAPPPPVQTVAGQIPDGQVQPITQIADGQPQAPTGVPPVISQISDGQPQAPTGSFISQISDGQPQAPTGAPQPPVISQISDGQPQAPTGSFISQISDGQPQAPTAPAPSSPAFTGAAVAAQPVMGALAAGLMGAVALL